MQNLHTLFSKPKNHHEYAFFACCLNLYSDMS